MYTRILQWLFMARQKRNREVIEPLARCMSVRPWIAPAVRSRKVRLLVNSWAPGKFVGAILGEGGWYRRIGGYEKGGDTESVKGGDYLTRGSGG